MPNLICLRRQVSMMLRNEFFELLRPRRLATLQTVCENDLLIRTAQYVARLNLKLR